MTYMVLSTEQVQLGQQIDLIKEGNVYVIHYTDGEHMVSIRDYNRDILVERYLKVVECFAKSWYSFDDRVKILKGEKFYD